MATYSDHAQRMVDQQFSAEMDRLAERAEMDRRDRREEREYDAMVRWYNPPRCRCPGDMPGHCPGPAFCPMCAESRDDSETQIADMVCPVCGEGGEPDEVPDPCEHPACPRKGLA